jgi:hypothetical protein
MTEPLSEDLRRRIVAARVEKELTRQLLRASRWAKRASPVCFEGFENLGARCGVFDVILEVRLRFCCISWRARCRRASRASRRSFRTTRASPKRNAPSSATRYAALTAIRRAPRSFWAHAAVPRAPDQEPGGTKLTHADESASRPPHAQDLDK